MLLLLSSSALASGEIITIKTPLIYRSFTSKAPNFQKTNNDGKKTKVNTHKLKQSEQDIYVMVNDTAYFVKFCASNLSRKKLEAMFSNQNRLAGDELPTEKTQVTLKVSIHKGLLDTCESGMIQSRRGKYVVIHKVVSNITK